MRGFIINDMKKTFLIFVFAAALASPAWGVELRLVKIINDSFPTNVLGTSISAPPQIHTIRSKQGAEYFLRRFSGIHNRPAHYRLSVLKKRLTSIDYSRYMAIAVFSSPMDNYKLKIKNVGLENGVITARAEYSHVTRNYSIPPKKSVYCAFAVVKNLPHPVALEAKERKVKNRASELRKVTVTGRLLKYSESAYQLVPVRIRHGKKNTYYIRGDQMKDLESYLGKVVTMAGTVSHEQNGPYEHELQVERVIKSHD
jgi:hypothetical protein